MGGTATTETPRAGGGKTNSPRPGRRHSLGESEKQDLVDQIKREHPLLDVLARLGVRMKSRGAWWEGNCPFPNHADPSPSFKVNKKSSETFHCFGCSAHGNIFTLARDLYGMGTFAEQVMFVTGRSWSEWVEGLPSSAEERERFRAQAEQARARLEEQRRAEEARWRSAPDHVVGPVYEALLARLDLDGWGLREVERRGIPADVARLCGYRTFPSARGDRIRLCEELAAAGLSLVKVPGFYRLPVKGLDKAGGRWCVGGNPWGRRDFYDKETRRRWEVGGLIIPLCDEEGRIVQLKLRSAGRPDDLPERFADFWPPKYMVLGSEDRDDGARPPLRAHFTGPPDGGDQPGVLWVTEGEIKADVGAYMLNARFCGLPGVGQNPELALGYAARAGFREVRVAMDSEDKQHVQRAIAELCRGAEGLGLTATVALWDNHYRGGDTKGIDDLLVAGGDHWVLDYADWWLLLDERTKEYVERRLAGSNVG